MSWIWFYEGRHHPSALWFSVDRSSWLLDQTPPAWVWGYTTIAVKVGLWKGNKVHYAHLHSMPSREIGENKDGARSHQTSQIVPFIKKHSCGLLLKYSLSDEISERSKGLFLFLSGWKRFSLPFSSQWWWKHKRRRSRGQRRDYFLS